MRARPSFRAPALEANAVLRAVLPPAIAEECGRYGGDDREHRGTDGPQRDRGGGGDPGRKRLTIRIGHHIGTLPGHTPSVTEEAPAAQPVSLDPRSAMP